MTVPNQESSPTPESTGEIATFDTIRNAYVELVGHVPASIEKRIEVARATDRERAVVAIEKLREALIMDNPLGRKTGQLVHFGQLLALGEQGPAKLHARAARQAGASLAELVGVAELALITSGMPAYSLGIEIISDLDAESTKQ